MVLFIILDCLKIIVRLMLFDICIDMTSMFSKLSGDSSPDVQYVWIFYMDVAIFKILYNR